MYVCVCYSFTTGACLPAGEVKGNLMPTTGCDVKRAGVTEGVCHYVGSPGMLNVSLHLSSVFSLGFMFKEISPKTLCITEKPQDVCERETAPVFR